MAYRLAQIGWRIILWNTAIGLVLGLLATLVGGVLIPLGSGLGGGYAIPDLLYLLAALLGLPGMFRGIAGIIKQKKDETKWSLVFIAPLLISVGYILIAHAIDPCINEIWSLSDRIGNSIPLCERFGQDINIHTRFHYLWHILPALPLVWLYGRMLRSWLPGVRA